MYVVKPTFPPLGLEMVQGAELLDEREWWFNPEVELLANIGQEEKPSYLGW